VATASMLIVLVLTQGPTVATPSRDAKAKAQVLVKHGAQHYQRGELGDAPADFQEAYAIVPPAEDPITLSDFCLTRIELGK